MTPKHKLFFVLFAFPLFCLSQENSPYSRYGIGNLSPQGNIVNRSMGGIAAGYSDGGYNEATSINNVNPASYGRIFRSTLNIAAQVDNRTIKSKSPVDKFVTHNAFISYFQLGFPLLYGNKKAYEKKISWGANLGLRPISNIAYKIQTGARTAIDSLATIYEGSGGLNEAFIGSGLQLKNFAIGFNAGYTFGNKTYSTRLIFINDTVNYLKSNSATKTGLGGISFTAGAQYAYEFKKGDTVTNVLRIGAYGNLQSTLTASQDIIRETFSYNANGGTDHLDSIFNGSSKGKMVLPSTFGIGFTLEGDHLLYGLDFETSTWKNYRFMGQKDLVQNTWLVKAGLQYFPARVNSRKYGQFIKYRAGIYVGPDYIVAGKKLQQMGVSFGAGLPLKLRHAFYENQRSIVNLALEYGNRGNSTNLIRENIFRISLGFALSDVWFTRYKYQ